MQEIKKALQAPFPSKDIEWRVQRSFNTNNGPKAIVVPYVQSRAIQNRLDDLFGPFGWESEYKELHQGVICGIRIHYKGHSIIKWDGGALCF